MTFHPGLEWVVNAYELSFGGLLLLGGRAGDLLGRRRVFVAGLGLFSAATLAGGFATSQAWLLAARAVQGVGGALIAPTSLALIVTTFAEGPARNRAMNGGGAAVGLIAGGLLTSYLSWRWVLFVRARYSQAPHPKPRSWHHAPRRSQKSQKVGHGHPNLAIDSFLPILSRAEIANPAASPSRSGITRSDYT